MVILIHNPKMTSSARAKSSSYAVKKQISPSWKWCGTYNNYDSSKVPEFIECLKEKKLLYMIGKEVGKSGTPHLQIFVYSPEKKKFRPIPSLTVFKDGKNQIHWERCRGSVQQNIDYCMKDGDYMTNICEYMPCTCHDNDNEPPYMPIMNEAWMKWYWNDRCEVCKLKDEEEKKYAEAEQKLHDDMIKWERKHCPQIKQRVVVFADGALSSKDDAEDV